MKIVIIGNMGYVGPEVVERLRETYPAATLIGYDTGFFASCLAQVDYLPERKLDQQFFGDIRNFPDSILHEVDAVVNLAAISNDPMGNRFEEITMDVNYKACIQVAKRAKAVGVKSFVFASSCSIYGATDKLANEDSNVNPLTTYARSKVYAERDLRQLAGDRFSITCLRFATACGMSSRLRLDLVLNDFVACALTSKKITLLSDGSPWRPLIHVKDMALAIDWAVGRSSSFGKFLAINVGSQSFNYQVRQLAEAVAFQIPNVEVVCNEHAAPDKRSYHVDFERYQQLAPQHQPQYDLLSTISGLKEGLESINFTDVDFRNSTWIRLNVLNKLQSNDLLNAELRWNFENQPTIIAV